MNIENLEKAGLTKNQSKIYVALLKLGSATAQQIMKESELHRSRVYDSLIFLEDQGLVSSVVRDFKKYFQAVSPDKLLSYVDEKKQAIREILPELKKLEGAKKEGVEGSVYKGKEGLKAIHSEMLKVSEGSEILVLGAKALIFDELDFFIQNFERERLKKKIKWKCLWDSKKSREIAMQRKLISGRVLPRGFDSQGVVNVFGDKVAIVLWKEKYPTGFLIESRDVAESYRKWFELIWRTAK